MTVREGDIRALDEYDFAKGRDEDGEGAAGPLDWLLWADEIELNDDLEPPGVKVAE